MIWLQISGFSGFYCFLPTTPRQVAPRTAVGPLFHYLASWLTTSSQHQHSQTNKVGRLFHLILPKLTKDHRQAVARFPCWGKKDPTLNIFYTFYLDGQFCSEAFPRTCHIVRAFQACWKSRCPTLVGMSFGLAGTHFQVGCVKAGARKLVKLVSHWPPSSLLKTLSGVFIPLMGTEEKPQGN